MRAIVAFAFMMSTGCAVSAARPLHGAGRQALSHPSADVVARVDRLVPGVVAPILSTEANVLADGRAEANIAAAPYKGLP